MAEPIDTTYFTALKQVTGYQCITGGIELTVDDMRFQIHVLRPDLLRVRATFDDFDDRPTFAVIAGQSESAEFEVTHDAHRIRIETSALSVVISRSPFRIDAYRIDGSPIFETADVNGAPGAFLHLNDEFLVARKLLPNDRILGLGEKTGSFNRRGRRFTLWNADVLDPDASGNFTKHLDARDPRRDPTSTEFDPYYMSIPFFYHVDQGSGAAAGFFVDNGFCGRYEFDRELQYRFHFAGGQYTEYIFAGPSIKTILAQYTWLTGRTPLPPTWALGYHQCRWHPYDHEKLGNLANTFRNRDIPCDGVWLDIDHMDGYRVYTWNTKLFPDIDKTVRELSERGFRLITIVDPGVKYEPGYTVFDDGMEQDVFCKTAGERVYTGKVWPGKTAFPDFSKQVTRDWWAGYTAKHIGLGIAGIWNDMNEPATGRISPDAMRFTDGRYPHEQFHNQYALLMAMSTREGILAAHPDKRTFILSRAGSAGIQRYAANWMGDNMARWAHLRMSVSMALGLGLSGQAFVGADVGGFAENSNQELLIRWMQYGALTPFCRNHNNAGCRDQYPWTYGEDAEELIRRSIQLRYRLMPALYAAFLEAAESGSPVQRPLVYDYQDDPEAAGIEDQYLLGSHLLIAPVMRPGLRQRKVYLPEGTWHDWHTGQVHSGKSWVVAKTPIDQIPIFARGGAVLPMWPEAPASTMGYQPESVELHVFTPTVDGVFRSTWQEDDGETFAFELGACLRWNVTLIRAGGQVKIDASREGDGYPEFRRTRFILKFHGEAPAKVEMRSRGVGERLDVIDGELGFANSGQNFACEFELPKG